MFDKINMLNLAASMASHSAQRHATLAENIANADTPGYKAKDLKPFKEVYSEHLRSGTALDSNFTSFETATNDAVSPNGNNVSLEDQMMRSAETQNDHTLSLMLYKKSLNMMKLAVGKNI